MQAMRPLNVARKIERIELLHLDERGYGPTGLLTRAEWREKCITMLYGSANEWSTWNNIEIKPSLSPFRRASFAYLIYFEGEKNPLEIEPHQNNLPSVTLDFIGLDFPNLHHIYRSFEGHVLFDACYFHENLLLLDTVEFKRFASFNYTNFRKQANFNLVKFHREVSFRHSVFCGDSRFNGASFLGDVSFNSVCFNLKAQFGGVIFSGNAIFKNCYFNLEAGFGGSKFKANAYFDGSYFDGLRTFCITPAKAEVG
jgi:hypothetical protein